MEWFTTKGDKMRKYGRVVNRHHVSYDPEITVDIFGGEHRIITLMERYGKKTVSKGFIRCLKLFIAEKEENAVEL